MAFTTEPNKVATSIPKIKIVLMDQQGVEDINGNPVPPYSARFQLEVMDQNGELIRAIHGDLEDHYTTQQLLPLKNMMDTFRADAEAQLLP
jgi:hypothetical protein